MPCSVFPFYALCFSDVEITTHTHLAWRSCLLISQLTKMATAAQLSQNWAGREVCWGGGVVVGGGEGW